MSESLNHLIESIINLHLLCGKKTYMKHRLPVGLSVEATSHDSQVGLFCATFVLLVFV